MVMDLLRTCYRHRVYWDDAKTRSSQIIWYRAADDALWFPYPHVFSSERYDTVHWWNDGAGEDELTGPTYSKGAPPGPFLGQSFCGPAEWFLGAPSNAPPLPRDRFDLPACCFPGEPSLPFGCPPCDLAARVYDLTMSGVANNALQAGCGACPAGSCRCPAWNGTWKLVWDGDQSCTWTAVLPEIDHRCDGPCITTHGTAQLFMFRGNVSLVIKDGCGNESVGYDPVGPFQCFGSTVFEKSLFNPFFGCFMPDTVTVTPAP